MSLSPKHQAFVREYCVDQNASAAARRAGYSKKTADRQGHRLLKNAEIAKAVKAALKAKAEAADISASRVLDELAAVAFAPRKGKGRASDKDKISALTLLGRYHGMWKDRVLLDASEKLTIIEKIVDAPHPDSGTPADPAGLSPQP